MNARRRAAFLSLGLLLATPAARADTPVVYDLSAGPTDVKQLGSSTSETVELRITLGSDVSAGTVCESGDGDELCGADVIVTLSGPGAITAFAPGPGVLFEPDPVTSTTTLRLNVLQSLSPPPPGPQNLGTLTVDGSGASPTNQLRVDASGEAVDAAGALVTIPTRTIALPEPSGSALLGCGILSLAALHGLRGRSRTASAAGR